jgi:hypothetical protein
VYLSAEPPAKLARYLENEYPDIKTVNANIRLIQTAGFQMLSHFTLPTSSWLDSFYRPMEKELSRLQNKYRANQTATSVFAAIHEEIDYYKQYSDYYGYEFFVMQKL